MPEIRPIDTLDNFDAIAQDFCELLTLSENLDIRAQFPETVASLTGSPVEAAQNLLKSQANCAPGRREQFIVFSGGRAVGMSVVRNDVITPEGIDSSWPNLSGFVCNPFRRQGLGRLSMQHRLTAVRERFGNHAWTYVKEGNVASEKLVLSAGFVQLGLTHPDHEDQLAYLYQGKN